MCGKEEDYFFNLNNFRDQFDSDEEDKLRSVLGDALLRYNINFTKIQFGLFQRTTLMVLNGSVIDFFN